MSSHERFRESSARIEFRLKLFSKDTSRDKNTQISISSFESRTLIGHLGVEQNDANNRWGIVHCTDARGWPSARGRVFPIVKSQVRFLRFAFKNLSSHFSDDFLLTASIEHGLRSGKFGKTQAKFLSTRKLSSSLQGGDSVGRFRTLDVLEELVVVFAEKPSREPNQIHILEYCVYLSGRDTVNVYLRLCDAVVLPKLLSESSEGFPIELITSISRTVSETIFERTSLWM